MLILTLSDVEAGLYGHIDSRVQMGNQQANSSGFLEEYADIRFVDKQQGIESGLAMACRQGDENEASLYQLYFSKKIEGPISSYRLGRFERSDSLGIYTLDGGLLKASNENTAFALYGGKPSRIDDYESIEGEALYGIDFYYSDIDPARQATGSLPGTVTARIGWQRLKNETRETRLSWGLTGYGEISDSVFHDYGFHFSGSYLLDENTTEQLQFRIYGDLAEKDRAQIDYEIFSPQEPYLSFREKYYSAYVNGRQTSLSASYFFSGGSNIQWIAKGRAVVPEQGESGYGLSVGRSSHEYSGADYLSQLDYLLLGDDYTVSWYAEKNFSNSAFSKSRLNIALQHRNEWLNGTNQSAGIEADIEQMLSSSLYLSFSVSKIWNSHADDDYLFGLKLSYHFNESNNWWSDD